MSYSIEQLQASVAPVVAERDALAEALRVGIAMARDTDASDSDEVGRAFDNFLNVARAALEKAGL